MSGRRDPAARSVAAVLDVRHGDRYAMRPEDALKESIALMQRLSAYIDNPGDAGTPERVAPA